jgi:hypothetical protein
LGEIRTKVEIDRRRFSFESISLRQESEIGAAVLDSVKARIQAARDVNDHEAKPLKPGRPGFKGYPDQKIERGLKGVRDWTNTGLTMASMQVEVSANEIAIDFSDPIAAERAHMNNQLDEQFGLSDRDREVARNGAIEAARLNLTVKHE